MTIEAAIIELNRLKSQERMDIDRARLGAAVVCFCSHEYKKVVYWLAAAVLNAAVTF